METYGQQFKIIFDSSNTMIILLQICVQRSLSAKNISHAKAGSLLAAYLKFTSFFFFVVPGMISRVLFPGTK